MSYTVNKLAKISSISVRTLHYYDEIGLLQPAYYGDNNYRYYEEEQLLLLQQILFYRELGFELSDIQKILGDKSFDKIAALQSHKKILLEGLDKTKNLIKTIDKTIAHLRGEETMQLEEIFHGFTAEKQELYKKFLIESGVGQDVINSIQEKIKNWTKEDWLENKQQADEIYEKLALAINHNLDPSSKEVQALIQKHYELTSDLWVPNRDNYISLGKFYGSDAVFVEFYKAIHPKLLNFLKQAMEIYAKKNLS